MFATLKEIFLPEQRQERRSDSTTKPGKLEGFQPCPPLSSILNTILMGLHSKTNLNMKV